MTTYQHPGVYIEEFEPASPIEGVGTSTAAFIGVANSGPIMHPTLITSWDSFLTLFGPHVEETFPSGDKPYLALAVKGFFQNGGTTCYVVRASSATTAHANLMDVTATHPLIVATARTEGAGADGITVTVAGRSLVHDALGADLTVHRQTTNIAALPNRRTLTVASSAGFESGDTVTLELAPHPNLNALVDATPDATTLTLRAPLPGADDYSGGTVRIADLGPGTSQVRVNVPVGPPLRRVLAVGSTIEIDLGTPGAEWATVTAVGNDSITFRPALTSSHALTADVAIDSREFDVHINDPATGASEDLVGLAMDGGHPNAASRANSALVQLTLAPPPPGPIKDPRPAVQTVTLAGGTDDDRATSWADLVALPDDALATLAPIDEVAIVAIPGATSTSAHQSIVTHCELMHDRVAVLDTTRGIDIPGAQAEAANATGDNHGFAALYYPWIQIINPTTRQPDLWPPSAHLAGVYARTDTERGVHKAPANTVVRGAIGLERRLTDADQDNLNPEGVSALRVPPNGGAPIVWGARTTTTEDRNWQYVNIRRLFNYLEESISEGIRWAVFEPNDLGLWKKLERSIGAFLHQEWRNGALFGAKPQQAYYVRIDEALNPPSTRSLGRLYIEIGIQPVYPAEFIIVRIGIWDGGSESSES